MSKEHRHNFNQHKYINRIERLIKDNTTEDSK